MRILVWSLAVLSFALAVQLPIRITTGAWQAHVPKVGAQSVASFLVVPGLLITALATVLLQGLHDVAHLVEANRRLAEALEQAHVPVANAELPRTDHAFDLILPRISPSGIAALYELERFLALLAVDADQDVEA